MTNKASWISGAALAFALIFCCVFGHPDVWAQQAEGQKFSNRWLLDAANDTERFNRLETYLGGFSGPMWEVGYRYQGVFDAIKDGNHDLASYHWNKIGSAMVNGTMKRPARKANADAMFLNGPWKAMTEALSSGEEERIRKSFLEQRQACIACHVAERAPFMNDQPLFRNTEAFAPASKP